MRRLLSTTALIAPLIFGTADAQTTTTTEPTTTQQTAPQLETETVPETDDLLEDDDDLETDIPLEIQTDTELDAETEADLDTDLDTDTDTEVDMPADTATQPVVGEPGETIVREQAPNELRVDWITGSRVQSLDGDNIGRISDLIFDEETNAITVAILSVGGFLGMGAKDIAIKFEELRIDFDAREIQLDLTREAADAAPEYVFRARAEAPAAAPPPADPGATGTMGGQPPAPLD